jgi:hypothetical protein
MKEEGGRMKAEGGRMRYGGTEYGVQSTEYAAPVLRDAVLHAASPYSLPSPFSLLLSPDSRLLSPVSLTDH